MASERLQLHSGFGRMLLLLTSTFFWQALAGTAVAWTLSLVHHSFGAACLIMPVYCIGMHRLSSWARRNATTVYATPAGLELSGPARTIPWQSVIGAKYVPFLSNQISAYCVTFKAGLPLTFYAREDVERVIQRFKHDAQAAA